MGKRRAVNLKVSGKAVASNTHVPRPPVLYVPLFTAVVELVLNDDALEILHALVAQLGFHSKSHRRPMCDGQIPTVHTVGNKSLRVQCVEQVDAVSPVIVRVATNETSSGEHARGVQHPAQWYTCPFANG